MGYEVERAVLALGMIPIATGVDEVRSAEVFIKHSEKISWASVQIPTNAELSHDGNSLSEDMFGIRRAILESTEPMAAFMSKANGEGHIEPMLGNRFTRQEVLAELKKEGYRLIGYCVFSKVE